MNVSEEEEKKLPVKRRIGRLAFLLSTRALNQDITAKHVMAISILTQAYVMTTDDESMSLKLMNVAKRIARG